MAYADSSETARQTSLYARSLSTESAFLMAVSVHKVFSSTFTPSLYATVSSMMLARAYDTPLLIQAGRSHPCWHRR